MPPRGPLGTPSTCRPTAGLWCKPTSLRSCLERYVRLARSRIEMITCRGHPAWLTSLQRENADERIAVEYAAGAAARWDVDADGRTEPARLAQHVHAGRRTNP